MKENKYDDEKFFKAYQNFPRSVEGLQAAGEWHELQKLLPIFLNKRVLDIGCGFGWHCIYAAEHGASYVLGIDISKKMLKVASEKTNFSNVEYQQIAMEEMEFKSNSFDVVLSSLAFHYTPNFLSICEKVYHSLSIGGHFVFSVEHPIFTAQGAQDWVYNDQKKDHWPVDNYFYEGKRTANFLGEKIIKYHKTLTTYLNTLIKVGFIITGIVEPQPASQLLTVVPDMKDEMRRPMMLLVSAIKK